MKSLRIIALYMSMALIAIGLTGCASAPRYGRPKTFEVEITSEPTGATIYAVPKIAQSRGPWFVWGRASGPPVPTPPVAIGRTPFRAKIDITRTGPEWKSRADYQYGTNSAKWRAMPRTTWWIDSPDSLAALLISADYSMLSPFIFSHFRYNMNLDFTLTAAGYEPIRSEQRLSSGGVTMLFPFTIFLEPAASLMRAKDAVPPSVRLHYDLTPSVGAPATTIAPAAGDTEQSRDIESRLKQLHDLREKGLITESEYLEKREAVIKDL